MNHKSCIFKIQDSVQKIPEKIAALLNDSVLNSLYESIIPYPAATPCANALSSLHPNALSLSSSGLDRDLNASGTIMKQWNWDVTRIFLTESELGINRVGGHNE
jgi:hypothetical protein